ncbi:MAG: signal peptidase II [Bacteroidota bacterium]
MARTLIIILLLASNIGCDQISKQVVRQNIGYDEQFSFINDQLTLMKVENTGAFLSLGHTLPQPFKSILLNIIPVLVLGFALLYLLTKKNLNNLTLLGVCFVGGGGIGNLYDRIIHGSVTDFVHIDFGFFQTGVFNMADVSIMSGMVMILLDAWLNKTKPDEEMAS